MQIEGVIRLSSPAFSLSQPESRTNFFVVHQELSASVVLIITFIINYIILFSSTKGRNPILYFCLTLFTIL
jgi:hypothetical protein